LEECTEIAIVESASRVVLLNPLSEVMMRKPFIVPVLRDEATLALLTQTSLPSATPPG